MSNNDSAQKKYFDIHTTGLGYLSRIREVKPKKGEAFLACTVAALAGCSDDIEYRYFDTKVVGAEAIALVNRCQEAVERDDKVLITFCIGDIWVDPFVYDKGPKQGQTGFSLKGRLLSIKSIKINGKLVHQSKSLATDSPMTASTASVVDGVESATDSGEYEVVFEENPQAIALPVINQGFDQLITD